MKHDTMSAICFGTTPHPSRSKGTSQNRSPEKLMGYLLLRRMDN